MIFRLLTLALLLASPPARADDSDPAMRVLQSTNPSREVQQILERSRSLYLRSEFALQKFDELLEQQKDGQRLDLFRTPEYLELLSLRSLSEESADAAADLYKGLLAAALGETSNPGEQAIAGKLLEEFRSQVRSTTANEVVFHNLLNEMNTAERSSGLLPLLSLSSTSAASEKELVDLVVRTRPALQLLGAMETEKQNDLSRELESLRSTIYKNITNEMPAIFLLAPGTGPSGNITGNNFPANTWAITYDDGPHPTYTMKNVRNLQANGIKATFFWLAKNVKAYPSIVNAVRAAGMPTENHSYSHAQLPKLGDAGLRHEIIDSTAVETQVYGEKPKFFRCPYGAGLNVTRVRKMIADQGMIHVFWNVDTLDWQDKNPTSILARAQKQMAAQGRGVILFHDIHPQSVEASRMVMEFGKGKGIRFVSIPEIAKQL